MSMERDRAQTLSGVIAIFAQALIDHRRPIIFGDGYQTRDFIHVSDVAKANMKALQSKTGYGQAFNVGTGKATTVKHLFELLRLITRRKEIQPIFRRARSGDIRDSCADLSRTKANLQFTPAIELGTGLARLIESLDAKRMD